MPAPKAACHRYDMSALNILLSNYHNFDKVAYSLYYEQFYTDRGGKNLSQADKLMFDDLVIKQNIHPNSAVTFDLS